MLVKPKDFARGYVGGDWLDVDFYTGRVLLMLVVILAVVLSDTNLGTAYSSGGETDGEWVVIWWDAFQMTSDDSEYSRLFHHGTLHLTSHLHFNSSRSGFNCPTSGLFVHENSKHICSYGTTGSGFQQRIHSKTQKLTRDQPRFLVWLIRILSLLRRRERRLNV
jgi:hypothetical protein